MAQRESSAASGGARPRSARSGAAHAVRRHRRRVGTVVAVLVTVGFTYIAVRGIDFEAAREALRTMDWWWLLPALVAFGLGNIARGLRWRSLFASGRRPPPGTTLDAMMIGYFYNNILPARAGEAARVLVLTQRSDSRPAEITGTVVLERVYDLVSLLLIFFVAAPWLPHVSWLKPAAIVAGVIAAGVLAVVVVLAVFGERPVDLALRPLRRFAPFTEERLERMAGEIVHGLSGVRHGRVAIEAFVWTTLAWLCSMTCAYVTTLAFHMGLPFTAGILVTVAVGLGMVLPSAPAAVGVFEGATLIALKPFGVAHSTALPYAVVLHLVNFIPFVLVGAALLQYNARHPRGASETTSAPVADWTPRSTAMSQTEGDARSDVVARETASQRAPL